MAPEPSSGGGGGGEAADPGLAGLSLPAAAIRRAAKSAAPGVHFSSEAVAGLHRVAQAFICFSTDRALHEVKAEGDKAKRSKGKANPAPRKTLTADHVMRFLSSEMPPISRKLATLYPDLMPAEYKPAAIKLLEQLQEQEKALAPPPRAAPGGAAAEGEGEAAAPRAATTLLSAFASASRKEAPGVPDAAGAGDGAPGEPEAITGTAGGALAEAEAGTGKAGEAKRKRGADGEPGAKKHAKVVASAPLEQFFGKRAAAAHADAPVATPARAASQAAAAAPGDGDNVASAQDEASAAEVTWPPSDSMATEG